MTRAVKAVAKQRPLFQPWLSALFAASLMLSVLLALASARPAHAATHIATTTYTSNTTWTLANSPYILDGNVTVASGATLTIEPAVVVKFNGTARTMFVNGTLNAVGTSGSRIVFTSYQDDTGRGGLHANRPTAEAPPCAATSAAPTSSPWTPAASPTTSTATGSEASPT